MNGAMETNITFVGYLQWLHVIFANPFVTWLINTAHGPPVRHDHDGTQGVAEEPGCKI